MKKLFSVSFLIVLLGLPGLLFAGEISNDSLEKILELSGTRKQVSEIPGMVKSGIAQSLSRGLNLPEAKKKNLNKVVDEAFAPDLLLEDLIGAIRSSISEEEAQELLSWYESDLGRHITAAEVRASAPGAYEEMISNAEALLLNEQLVLFAVELDELLGVSDVMVIQQQNMTRSAFMAVTKVLMPGRKVDTAIIDAQLTAQEPQMRAGAEKLSILSFLHCYKDISIADLEKYLEFLKTPTARKLNGAVGDVLKTIYDAPVERMLTSLAPSVSGYDQLSR